MTPGQKANALRRARKLLDDRASWTKGAPARDASGFSVQARDVTATCYCSIGAVVRVVGDSYEKYEPLLRELRPGHANAFTAVQEFNDAHDTQHADVLRMFDEAIYRAERAEAAPC